MLGTPILENDRKQSVVHLGFRWCKMSDTAASSWLRGSLENGCAAMGNQYVKKPEWPPELIEERRKFVLECRRRSLIWDRVVVEVVNKFGLSISAGQCAEDFRVLMRKRNAELSEAIDDTRNTMLDQIDAVSEKMLEKALNGDVDAADTLIKLWTRKARLIGADAPVVKEIDDKRTPLNSSPSAILVRIEELRKKLSERLSGAPSQNVIDVTGSVPEPREVEYENLAGSPEQHGIEHEGEPAENQAEADAAENDALSPAPFPRLVVPEEESH